jgi:ADP-ribose pyrophosphatase
MQKILPPDATLIPNHATHVFSGAIFDVYQWPQTMSDGRTETFEMLKRPDTVQALVVRNNQILLVMDEQPGRSAIVDLPQGRVDEDDESWSTAAQREVREETGLVCSNWRLVHVGQPFTKLEWFAALYLAHGITEELPQKLDPGGEKISLVWRDFDELRQAILSGNEPTMSYLIPFLRKVKTMDGLMTLPSFIGTTVNR